MPAAPLTRAPRFAAQNKSLELSADPGSAELCASLRQAAVDLGWACLPALSAPGQHAHRLQLGEHTLKVSRRRMHILPAL
jgi:hypothetical protein